MSGKLALQYPLHYASIFEPYNDFIVHDLSLGNGIDFESDKEIWIDCSKMKHIPEIEAVLTEGVILPTHDDPDRNVLNIARTNVGASPKIGIWRGERRHLKLLEQCCDIVALPYYEYGRMNYVNSDDTSKYHLYGFCNLDELRRFPVRSISTSIPITAAISGIDLRLRERRPKSLPAFSYDLRLNDKQLELAVQNVLAIKEALASHEY